MKSTINWASALIIIGALVYFWEYEPPFLSYQGMPFPLNDKIIRNERGIPVVRAGDEISYTATRCSTRHTGRVGPDGFEEETVYITTRRLIPLDKTNPPITLPGTGASVPYGCKPTDSSMVLLPRALVAGEYYAAGIAKVDATLGPDRQVPWKTEVFQVLPLEKP